MLSPIAPKTKNQHADALAGGIVAQLSDSDTCTALGLTAQSTSPVLALCRQLVAAGHDPAQPLHVFRGNTLALIIRSIAARLEINGEGTGFRPRRQPDAGSLAAPKLPVRIGHRARRERAAP